MTNTESSGVETRIMIENTQRPIVVGVIVWVLRFIVSITVALVLGYGFLYYTEEGEEIRMKHEGKVKETERRIEDDCEFLRFYALYFGHPPKDLNEVMDFSVKRAQKPFTHYNIEGRTLPWFQFQDGFGKKIRYNLDEVSRTMTLTSLSPTGPLGVLKIFGVENIKRTINY